MGQLDVEPDRETPGFGRAAVGRLHQSRPAAGDHGESLLGEAGSGLPAQLVPAVALADPSGAEYRDPVLDVPQRVEGGIDLGADPLDPAVIFGVDVGGHAEQPLIAFRSAASSHFGHLALVEQTAPDRPQSDAQLAVGQTPREGVGDLFGVHSLDLEGVVLVPAEVRELGPDSLDRERVG